MKRICIALVMAVVVIPGCTMQTPESAPTATAEAVSHSFEDGLSSAGSHPGGPSEEELSLAASEERFKQVSEKLSELTGAKTTAAAEAEAAKEQAAYAREATLNDKPDGGAKPPAFVAAERRTSLVKSVEDFLASCDIDAHRSVLRAIEDSVKSGRTNEEGEAFSPSDIRTLEAAGVKDPHEAIRPCYQEIKPSTVSWSLDGWIGETCALVAATEKYDAPTPSNIARSVAQSCSAVSSADVYVAKRAKELQQFYRWVDSEFRRQQVIARREKSEQLAALAETKAAVLADLESQLVELSTEFAAVKPQYERYLALRKDRETALAKFVAARNAIEIQRANQKAAEAARAYEKVKRTAQRELEKNPELCLKKQLSPSSFTESYRRYGDGNSSERSVIENLIQAGDYHLVDIRPDGSGCRVILKVSGIADGNSFNRTLIGWAL